MWLPMVLTMLPSVQMMTSLKLKWLRRPVPLESGCQTLCAFGVVCRKANPLRLEQRTDSWLAVAAPTFCSNTLWYLLALIRRRMLRRDLDKLAVADDLKVAWGRGSTNSD